jgi:hypothetical protein
VSSKERQAVRARELGQRHAGLTMLDPGGTRGKKTGHTRGLAGRAGMKAKKRNKTPFLFPFQIFQSIFKLF